VLEERRTNTAAGRVVSLWSKRLARGAEPLMIPTIAAAVRAGRPWLSYQCPACIDAASFPGRTVGLKEPAAKN
jgi:hypothetical protein